MKGEARHKWLKLVNDPSILAADDYAVDNTYEVDTSFENQMSLVAELLDEDAIETIKNCLQETKKAWSIKIDIYIRRIKILNNCIPFMDKGAVKLTERELIQTVVLKKIPVKRTLDLNRTNNYNLETVAAQ